jgi:hypothetical protein
LLNGGAMSASTPTKMLLITSSLRHM